MVLYKRRMLTTLSIQREKYLGKIFLPQKIILYRLTQFSNAIPLETKIFCVRPKEKCLATGFSILWCLMFDLWPVLVKRTRSAFSISLTYWMAYHLHSIKCTTLLVPRSVVTFTRNYVQVVVLLNIVPVFMWPHALHDWWLHGLLFLCCLNASLTKTSLSLGERKYAT